MGPANPPDLGWLPRSRTLLQAAGALLAVALVLGFLGFSHKPTVPAPAKTDYTQKVTFAYDAATEPNMVYPDGRVHDGDPIFTKLIQRVHFTAAYDFTSGPEHSVGGTIALDAVVSDSSGWKTTMLLTRQQPFAGDHAEISGDLDPRAVLAMTDRVQALTGVGGSPTVAVTARVHSEGTLDGTPIGGDIAPNYAFAVGDVQMKSQGSPTSSTDGSRSSAGSKPNTVKLLVVKASVPTVRVLAVLALLLALAAGIVGAVSRRREERASEVERILRDHKHLIVPGDADLPPGLPVTDVADMEALVRLAKRYERLILHSEKGDEHTFVVDDAGSIYRYRVRETFRRSRRQHDQAPASVPQQCDDPPPVLRAPDAQIRGGH